MANLLSSYRLVGEVELFVRIDNLCDTDYKTFGILAELELALALDEVPGHRPAG